MTSDTRAVPETPLFIVAAVIADPQGRVLVVRKQGTTVFIQPGGKREPGEMPLTTLARELDEELGITVIESSACLLGEFEAAAVNESGRRVRAIAYALDTEDRPEPRAEIVELAWIDPARPNVPIAPLSSDCILPAWLSMRADRRAAE